MTEVGLLEQTRDLLPPALLEELSTLWFQHISDEQNLVIPSQETMMQWFRKDEAFDKLCSAKFRRSLDQIKTLKVTGETIIRAVQPDKPLEWIRLIILLDQMPRNIYRGEESSIAFAVFDPIAQHIAQAAVAAGVQRHPVARYRIGHRLWFNMPFMHSEDRAMHQKAVELIQDMASDIKASGDIQQSLAGGANDHYEDVSKCKAIIASNRDAAVKLCESQLQFEIKHKDIIDRFGRYPHRNGPLGRHMTMEEQEFLDGGGDTFGG
ncbi:hypothetical protein diail_8079 [Diaporthe ilicicola]|nr:hypothetical protein diail_8079 [Diaporthe ilicicola]